MSNSQPSSKFPSSAAALPIQFAKKSSAAAPKLNSEMEMGSLAAVDGQGGSHATAAAPAAPPPENDIMQLARIGDIVAMEKLLESGDYDATYSDDEGITPLHVRAINRLLKIELTPLRAQATAILYIQCLTC